MTPARAVLVTGIGGNVGQGVLRNLRALDTKLWIVGSDIGRATAGHHFCDAFAQLPYAYDPEYVPRMVELCRREQVELVIPSTDYETYHLGLARNSLPALLVSPPEVTRMCLDKWETWQALAARSIPFADSSLPSQYRGDFPEIIVKPREGRGSRGVHVNPPDWRSFDDSNVIQQRLLGPEITTAFYVTREGRLLGEITFERTLVAGATERATVTFAHEKPMRRIIDALVRAFEIRGPCNVQSIVTVEGPIPFELNCRYSGTNSIRARFGFEDVRYGIEEYLLGTAPASPHIRTGSAIRVALDVIYPDRTLDEIEPGAKGSYIF
jgi:carbamoyl-phosphate synthase large subunit